MSAYSDKFVDEVKKDPMGIPPRKLAQMIVDKVLDETVLDPIRGTQKSFVQEVTKIVSGLRLKYGESEAWESCTTIIDYQNFKKDYPNSIHIAEAEREIKNRLIKEEENVWNSCITVTDYQNFKKDYPNSIHIAEADKEIKNLLIKEEENDWNRTCNTHTKEAYQAFKELYSNSEHVKDAIKALEMLEREEEERERKAKEEELLRNEENAWNNCIVCQDFVVFKQTHTASLHVKECEEKAWVACLACNKKEDYQIFITTFPVSRHRAEAEEKLNSLLDPDAMHNWLRLKTDSKVNINRIMDFYDGHKSFRKQIHDYFVEDMPFNPNRYARDAMARILRTDIFEPGELVRRRILTETAKNWIEQHARDADDEHVTDIPVDTSPVSPEMNTDVYFFGVPGSGKSTVLAGLFKLESENVKNQSFKLLTNTKGYNYAKDLTQYVKEGLFPLPTKTETTRQVEAATADEDDDDSTDFTVDDGSAMPAVEAQNVTDKYIQIMNTELTETVKDKDYTHYITFIEMPGERTLQFAAGGAGGDLKSLGLGTEKLFRNGNRKIIFFILDPDPKKGQFVKVNQADVFITQGETLNLIVELIAKNPDILDTVDAIHIILTKSDILPCYCSDIDSNAAMDDLIEKVMDQEGYAAFKRELIKLCSPKNSSINKHCGHRPYVFTFSLGKVMPGHVVDYRRASSEIILNVIRANTRSVRENSGFDSFKERMNRIPFKK